MQINPYLSFNGDCETAFKFYEQCLGGKIDAMLTYRNSPIAEETPPELQDKIMHAHLIVGDRNLMGADCSPQIYEKPQGFSVMLDFEDPGEGERIFSALAEGGKIQMPMQATFWAKRFGMVSDRFGTPWAINGGLTD
jgi:PhnB protein